MGGLYPYIILGIGEPLEYAVLHACTGAISQTFPTCEAAMIHAASLKVRDMMHG